MQKIIIVILILCSTWTYLHTNIELKIYLKHISTLPFEHYFFHLILLLPSSIHPTTAKISKMLQEAIFRALCCKHIAISHVFISYCIKFVEKYDTYPVVTIKYLSHSFVESTDICIFKRAQFSWLQPACSSGIECTACVLLVLWYCYSTVTIILISLLMGSAEICNFFIFFYHYTLHFLNQQTHRKNATTKF